VDKMTHGDDTLLLERERLRLDTEHWERDALLRERELDLRAREVTANRTAVITPIAVAGIAGTAAVLGAVIGAFLQGSSNLTLEKSKLESSLILRAVATGDQDEAVKNLKFLLDTHLIEDRDAKLRNAVDNSPQTVAVLPAIDYQRSGIESAQKGQISNAIAAYRKALALKSDDAATYNLLGYALLKNNAVDEAISNLRKSIEIDKNSEWGYYNLALALWAKGNHEEAIRTLSTLITMHPGFRAIVSGDKQFTDFQENSDFRTLLHSDNGH
jgi:tetratricopeptide (TPR) repeat protein